MAMEALRLPAQALGYRITGELKVLGKFEAGGVEQDPDVLRKASALGEGLAQALGP